jgi:uncharacterized protein YggE
MLPRKRRIRILSAPQNVIQNVASPSESEGSIALGQIKVNARVTVSFELE